MSAVTPDDALVRDNIYLRRRNAQLQEDMNALLAENLRMRQALERLHGRNPLRSASMPGNRA